MYRILSQEKQLQDSQMSLTGPSHVQVLQGNTKRSGSQADG